jgi:hypothetical protein
MSHNSIILFFIFLLCILGTSISCTEDPVEEDVANDIKNAEKDPILQDYESPDRKIGYIDEEGEIVIQAQFDEGRAFQNGLASVNQEGLWGYINTGGSFVIPPKYLGSWTFSNGLGRVQSAQNRKFGFVSPQGDTIVNLQYTDARDFKGSFAAVSDQSYWGVIDREGKEVIPPQFNDLELLANDMVAAQENKKWGVYQIGVGWILNAEYEKIYELRSDILRVKDKKGNLRFISLNGEDIFGRSFPQAFAPQEGTYTVCDTPGLCYLLNRKGDKISSPYQMIRPANANVYIAKRNNQWGVINENAEMLIPFRYDLIYNFQEGYAPYLKNKLWGYLSAKGEVKTPPTFGLAWPFQNGKARVLTRNGIAIINTDFKIIIPASKGELRDFSEGLAPFKAY